MLQYKNSFSQSGNGGIFYAYSLGVHRASRQARYRYIRHYYERY